MPWHPAVVHLPIGLAVVVPLVAAVVAGRALMHRRLDRASWSIVVLLQALVVCGGLVALRTGKAEEERVENRVPETAVERHEERAETFVWVAGAALVASGTTLVLAGTPAAAALAITAAVASVGVAGAAVWVGHAGGELVYRHGAAGVPDPLAGGGDASGRDDD